MFAYIPTSNEDYYKPELFWNRLYAFYENFSELVGMNVLGRPLPKVVRIAQALKFSGEVPPAEHRSLRSAQFHLA
jgi:hypothetical protein